MLRSAWSLVAVAGAFGLVSADVGAAEPELVWETEGFDAPESAIFDEEAGVLYVSNINGEGTDKDGNGYIAKVSPAGEIVEQQWATGLDAPKGLALHEGTLYVSDIDRLVAIDTQTGKIQAVHDAPDAQFLNDVTAHEDGRIFVSDMVDDAIYVLDGDSFAIWLKDPGLEAPNGLRAEPDRLLVAAWGVMTDGFATAVPGHLKAVDYETKEITSLGGEPVGNLDGLEPDGKGGYLVTDWMAGGLFQVSQEGKAVLLLDLNQGSADHEVIEAEQLAVIPMMMDGKLAAYRVQ